MKIFLLQKRLNKKKIHRLNRHKKANRMQNNNKLIQIKFNLNKDLNKFKKNKKKRKKPNNIT